MLATCPRAWLALGLLWLVGACVTPRHPAESPPDPATLARAVWRGDRPAVQNLLARGADVDATDPDDRTAWQWAATADDRPMLELLLARAPRLADRLSSRLALRTAAARDDAWLVDALLTRGVPSDGAVDDARASALAIAAANGALAALQRLIAGGATVGLAGPDGDTALAAAVRAGCEPCVDLLLAHGADVHAHDAAGRTPAMWAARTGQPELATRLGQGEPPTQAPPPTLATAIARALPLLQANNARWQADGECTACHHLPMAIRAIALADRKGLAIDRTLAGEAIAAVRGDDAKFAAMGTHALGTPDGLLRLSMVTGGDPAFGNAWFLDAEIDAALPAEPPQRTLAMLLARLQQPDGRWRRGPFRGVIECSDVEATALAIRVIAGYGDASAQRVLPSARAWLARAPRTSIVDRAFALRAGVEPGREIAALRALQRADGSWSHAGGAGDAYSTGLVAVALVEAGVAPADPAIARAAAYLLATQEPDGSWFVPSRAPPLLPFHDRGFPHGRMQFVSYAGTAWATMTLIHVMTSEARDRS